MEVYYVAMRYTNVSFKFRWVGGDVDVDVDVV